MSWYFSYASPPSRVIGVHNILTSPTITGPLYGDPWFGNSSYRRNAVSYLYSHPYIYYM
uniref:Uncharacterized protein n=1 Tax=viral metagenome TaxID=1070528 RepID=A0A6C0BNQ1_9ZZZZ